MKRLITIISILSVCSFVLFGQSRRKRHKKIDTNTPEYQAMINAPDDDLVFPESIENDTDDEEVINKPFSYSWLERMFIHADTTCVSDSISEEISDSLYIMRLEALPTIIEMPFNAPIRRCLDLYVHRRRSAVERMVGIGYNYYFPIFEEALQRHEMPSELKYLACIESALKQNAFSRAKAAGLWQFMPATGMILGLEINSFIDERYDLYKSTDAACRYLKKLYNMYDDWAIAIAAYNCGPGNVNKAIARSGGRHTFWEIYNFLPAETRSYVPLFVAATYIMTYHCEHNLCATIGEIPPQCDTIMINSMVHFDQIANVIGVPVETLESMNPQYILDIIPASREKALSLTLPAEKTVEFIELQDSIMAFKADSLLPHNGEIKEIFVRGKRNSYVQSGGNKLGAGKTKGKAGKGTASGDVHVVRKGQTLSYIARKYGTTVNKIKSLNNLKSDNISVGQHLRVR